VLGNSGGPLLLEEKVIEVCRSARQCGSQRRPKPNLYREVDAWLTEAYMISDKPLDLRVAIQDHQFLFSSHQINHEVEMQDGKKLTNAITRRIVMPQDSGIRAAQSFDRTDLYCLSSHQSRTFWISSISPIIYSERAS
jgi:hypothetical protein